MAFRFKKVKLITALLYLKSTLKPIPNSGKCYSNAWANPTVAVLKLSHPSPQPLMAASHREFTTTSWTPSRALRQLLQLLRVLLHQALLQPMLQKRLTKLQKKKTLKLKRRKRRKLLNKESKTP